MADKTDKRAFYTLMGMAVIVGIIAYYLFTAATPKAGIVDSIYRQELPPCSCSYCYRCSWRVIIGGCR